LIEADVQWLLFDIEDKDKRQWYGIGWPTPAVLDAYLPAYFDAAEECDDHDEDEERASGNRQLHQDRVHSQVVILTVRVVAVHQ